jgi:hypothetical protein
VADFVANWITTRLLLGAAEQVYLLKVTAAAKHADTMHGAMHLLRVPPAGIP